MKKKIILAAVLLTSSAAFDVVSGDNTKINQRDKSVNEMTADQQKMNSSDTEITRLIRKDIMAEDMSTYAHNIKVITMNGRVTLKGPVRSKDEKMLIWKHAVAVAGKANVVDQIRVVPEKK